MSSDRRLRVLALATTFPASAGDGTPEFVLSLSSALCSDDVELRVVVPRVAGSVPSERMAGVDVRRFGYFPRRFEGLADGAIMANLRAERWRAIEAPPLVASFTVAAVREAKRWRPDVVHAHWVVPAGLVAYTLRRTLGIPYVVTAHGADAFVLNGRVPGAVKRKVLQHASATVPVSTEIGRQLSKFGAVTEPIPMGVDVSAIEVEVGPRRPVGGRILFVGRLVEKKGVDVLLRALATTSSASAAIVGDGPSRSDLERLASDLGVTDRVTFLGHRGRQEVMDQLAIAALVALPSQIGAGGDQDGTPVVLGEAMAAGVPVVVSDLGGLAEQVIDGETGWVVTPGSVDALSKAISEAIGDPEDAARRAGAAKSAMIGSLDLASVGDRYQQVLRRAVDDVG